MATKITKEQAIANINSVKSTSASDKANAIKALDSYYPSNNSGSSTDPILSGTKYESSINSLGNDLKNKNSEVNNGYDKTSLENNLKSQNKLLEDRMKQLETQYQSDIGGIKTAYQEASLLQSKRQEKDYAGRATGLITAGGGFLGGTQSQQGVLQSLTETHEQEKNALMAKRDAALQEATSAYQEKNFKYAQEQLKLANDTEKELYQRQKDFAEQSLALSREKRAQQEFDIGITDKKIENISLMSDEEYANITPEEKLQLDSVYGINGYTDRLRNITKKAQDIKSISDEVSLKKDIQDLINSTPSGKIIKIGDKTYYGVKKPEGGSTIKDPIPASIALQLGAPNLAGQSQEETILSLSLTNAPLWYQQLYKAQNPTGWEIIKNNPIAINEDWNLFRNQPEFTPFKNTVDIDKSNNQFILGSLPSTGVQSKPTTPTNNPPSNTLKDKWGI